MKVNCYCEIHTNSSHPMDQTHICFLLSNPNTHTHTQTRTNAFSTQSLCFPSSDYLCSWQLVSWVVCRYKQGRGTSSWCWLLVQSQTETGSPRGAPCWWLVVWCWVEWPPLPYHQYYLSKNSQVLIVCMWLCRAPALRLCVQVLVYRRGSISKCVYKCGRRFCIVFR